MIKSSTFLFKRNTKHSADGTKQNEGSYNTAELQQFLHSFIAEAPTPTMVFNTAGELIMNSKSVSDLWLFDVNTEVRGYNIFSDGQLKEAGIMPLIQKAFEGKTPDSVEIYYDPGKIDNPGRARWIRANAYPIFSTDEHVHFVIVKLEDISNQKQAEQNASNYLETLKDFMNSTEDAMVIYDRDFNILEVNSIALSQMKITREEALGANIKEFLPGFEKTKRYKKYLEVIETGISYEEEVEDHPFAPDRILLIKAFRITNGMGITTSDITESRNALKREYDQRKDLEVLRDSAMDFVELSLEDDLYAITANKLSIICEGSPVVINMVDPKTKRILVRGTSNNPEHASIVKELIGSPLLGRSFPYYRNEELLKSGKLKKVSQGLYHLSGGELHEKICKVIEERLGVRSIYSIGFNRKGILYGNAFILVNKDQIKLKANLIEAFINQLSIAIYRFRSEKAFHDSEQRFKAAFGTSPDAVNINRLEDGMYIDINEGFTNIIGYTRDDIIGYTSLEKNIWAKPEDRAFLVEELNRKGYVKNLEAVFQTRDGKKKVGMMSANKFSKDGVNYIISITRDITERVEYQEKLKEARAKAEESDRLKSAFLANISHEVRTPMNAIMGFTDMLMHGNPNDERKNEYIRLINKSSHNLLSIINDIIDFSMIETGQLQIYRGQCAINMILEDLQATIEEFKKMESKEHLELHLTDKVNESDNYIECDEQRIKQVMTNLLGNAIKYTEKGSVSFGCKIRDIGKENALIEFYVKDTGIGISKDKHKMIFERFRQLDDSNTRKYGGNGLGLSISKQISNLLGGDIRLESKPGRGSTFYFYLPHKPVARPIRQEDAGSEVMDFDWADKHIIIAEDVSSNYYLIKSMLDHTSIEVEWARNGKEALDLINAGNHYDMILMDVRMPVMTGYEATREIRKIDHGIPIIALSANALQRDIDISLEHGCNDHISKPVKQELLLLSMAQFLS